MGKIFSVAWPLILANITVPLLGLVDTGVLGHLQFSFYIGAVSVASNCFALLYLSFGFLRTTTVGLSAQAKGRNNTEDLTRTLLNSTLIAIIGAGLLISSQDYYLKQLLQLFNGSESVQYHALQYAQIRLISAPATLITYAAVGWLIGVQNTKAIFIILSITNLLNIILDLIFVIVLDLAVVGVAWASVIAEYTGLVVAIKIIGGYRGRYLIKLSIKQALLKSHLIALFHLNSNIFFRTLTLIGVFAYFTAQGALLGDDILAANAILINFLFFISNALDGFANAAEAKTGNAIGARNISDFHQYSIASGIWCLTISLIMVFAFYLLGGIFINLITDIVEVREHALEYLPWLIILPLVSSWSYLFDGIFIGATKVIELRNTVILPTAFIFFPSWFFLQTFNNHGLWISLLLFMLARSLLGFFYYLRNTNSHSWC